MTNKNQIQLVKDQSEEQQRRLSERFEKAVSFVQAERKQLIQLQDYEADYLNKIKEKQQEWSAQNASHYRHFCHQLSQAIVEQEGKLEQAEVQLGAMRVELRQQQQRIQVLDDMIKREKSAAAHMQNHLLQKELDEHSNRMYYQ